MQIVDFAASHIEQTAIIAKQNYEEERRRVPALPPVDVVPNLEQYVENGLGVTAFDGGKIVGFLCAVGPFKNAFRSTDATGVFSPMGFSGAIGENKAVDPSGELVRIAGDIGICLGREEKKKK